jgi:hypothetical protein
MTVDPALLNVFMAVMTILVCGLGIKIGYNWLQTGRIKTGEYYRTVESCDECREKCCVNSLKIKLSDHISQELGQASRVDQKLNNIEKQIDDAKTETSKMREEVTGIRSALDRLAGTFEGYVKRTGEHHDS